MHSGRFTKIVKWHKFNLEFIFKEYFEEYSLLDMEMYAKGYE